LVVVDYFIEVERSYPTESRDSLKAEECLEIGYKVWPILSEWKPDVIHLNDRQVWMPFRNFPNTVFSLHLSMPDLTGLRGMDAYWFHELKVERDACARAGALVVYSQFTREIVWEKLCEFAAPLVLPLGFDGSKFHAAKPADRIVISYFGRLAQGQKGFVEYLQAVDMLDEEILRRYEIEFNVYGKGQMPDWLPTRRITTVAFLEGEALTEAYARSHIVVMPSKYEPFGLVGLEALASGCLLLCTEGQGMDEYLVPGKNYLPIRSDPFDIKARLEEVLSQPGRYLGRERAIMDSVKDWTWERCVTEHLKVYHQVMTGRAPFLKWANGKLARQVESWWKENGEKRKAKLGPILKEAAACLGKGKTLVLGATEAELSAYAGEGRELIPHSFHSRNGGFVSFATEYILVPPDSVDQTIFLLGPEYVTNFELSLRELYRITREQLVLGISYGERSFAQTSVFPSRDALSASVHTWPLFECLSESYYDFVDGVDGKGKSLGLFSLRKRSVEELRALQEGRP